MSVTAAVEPPRGLVAGTLLVALLALGVPGRAHAQQWGVSAGASVGSTVNGGSNAGMLLPVPEEMGQSATQTDMFVRTAVGAEYFLRTHRANHQFTYNFANFVHFGEGRLFSFNNDLLWLGSLAPTRFTELNFTGGASQGRTGDLALFNRAPPGESVARPGGSISFVGLHLGENFAWHPDPFWIVGQDLEGDGFLPYGDGSSNQAKTLGANAHLGLSRRWDRDGFGLRSGVGHGRSSASVIQETQVPARRANFADATLTYDHIFSDDWDIQASAGLLGVQVPQVRDPFLDVTATLGVGHRTDTGGAIGVQANRGVVTNVFVGDVLLQTGAGVRVTQFFGRDEAWQVVGGVDYQQGKSVFVVDTKEGGLKVFSAAASLNYEWSRHILFELESNYTYQDAEASRRLLTFIPPYTLHRFMAMLSIAYVFPQPEKLSGGGGGRRRPRLIRGRAGTSEVGTGLEGSAIGPTDAEGAESGAEETRGQRRPGANENRSDSPDIGRGPIDEPITTPGTDVGR